MSVTTSEQFHNLDDSTDSIIDDIPLISILIYNYVGNELAHCLQSIFNQHHIANFEVIICDDASDDGAWDIANRYASIYAGKITLSRNRLSIGVTENRQKGLLMCKGVYAIELTMRVEFNPHYARSIIDNFGKDPLFTHSYITRLKAGNFFIPPYFNPIKRSSSHDLVKQPLVSICIYNYNYGRYLRQCFDSVIAQTYGNIEICFSDNASTDDSWNIALEYARTYPDKVNLTRNRMNYGASINLWNCNLNLRGKYMLKLCSDDAIQPEFVERCVSSLEKYSDAAFVMVHREMIDEQGESTSEPSFYEQSCVIPSEEQAAVYMMSSVNPCVSQIFYNVEKTGGKRMAGNLNDRWFGDRLMDFHICCDFPIVYIKEPLLLNRIHGDSDSTSLDNNLLQCLGEYVLVHQFADIAATYPGMEKAVGRLPLALEKLANLCVRYCLRALIRQDDVCAQRYFHLAIAIFPDIQENKTHIKLAEYWSLNMNERKNFVAKLVEDYPEVVKRNQSYPVPPGSILC